jgi:6-phosphofructokinase 1
VTATQRQVNIADRMWARLLSSTNQPDFLRYKKAMQELRKQLALKQAEKIESDVAAHNSNSAPTSSSSPSVRNPSITHQLLLQGFCSMMVIN